MQRARSASPRRIGEHFSPRGVGWFSDPAQMSNDRERRKPASRWHTRCTCLFSELCRRLRHEGGVMVQDKHAHRAGQRDDSMANGHQHTRGTHVRAVPEQQVDLNPEEVLEIILAEHANLRRLLQRLETHATSLLACSVPNPQARLATRELALRLCAAMTAHVQLENRILLPVLTGTDAWGAVRAEQVAEEHSKQLLFLAAYADTLAAEDMTNQTLAVASWRLARALLEDMAAEEASVLSHSLIADDGISTDVETG